METFAVNKPTPEQERWLTALRRAGVAAPLWYPDSWPVIVAVLTAGKDAGERSV